MKVIPADNPIDFAERALSLFDEARVVATYKYAVSVALMDLCLEGTSAKGEAPRSVSTRELGEKVIELYWRQTVPFTEVDGSPLLRQNTGAKDAYIPAEIRRFRAESGADPSVTLARARLDAPVRFDRLVDRVQRKLVQMPLPRLQFLGNEETRFIYDYDFGADTERLHLVGDAGSYLVQLNGLLRPLIQQRWIEAVRRINRSTLRDQNLAGFLFGADRISLEPVRLPLAALQGDRCFYCGRFMSSIAVDHFLPWSRHADDGVFNLVGAHPKCNAAKRDHLASIPHLARWRDRATPGSTEHGALKEIAAETGFEDRPERALSTARGIYLSLKSGAMLWEAEDRFEEVNAADLRLVLVG